MPNRLAVSRAILRGHRFLTRERGVWSMLSAVLGILLLVQLLVVAVFSVQAGVALLQSRTDIRIEMQRQAQANHIQEFYGALQSLPAVDSVQYVTRAQAYAQEKAADPSLTSFIDKFGLQNPFPDSFAVTLSSPHAYDDLLTFVSDPKWAAIVDPSFLTGARTEQGQLRQMLSFLAIIQQLSWFFLTLGIITLLAVITAIARLRIVRRSGDSALHFLLGARPFDLLFPIVWEIACLLVLAVILSGLITVGLLFLLPQAIPAADNDTLFVALQGQMIPLFEKGLPLFVLAELVACPLVALVCVAFGVRWKPEKMAKAA